MYFSHPQFKRFSLKAFGKSFSEAELRNKLAKIFPDRYIIFTDSGRSAFRVAIKELGLENSEMLIPAYICDIFKPILQYYNIKPIYLDINLKTFHAGLSDIETKITPKTKSILICHTYGLPVEIDKILKIAENHNLKIIEDCAHLPIGLPRAESRGDCAFFSFAKLFPVVNGGMLISKRPMNIKLAKYKSKLSNLVKFLRLFPALTGLSERFRFLRPVKGFQRENQGEVQGEKLREKPKRISKKSLKALNYYLNNHQNQISKRIELAKYFQEKLSVMGFKVQESNNNYFTYLSTLVPENINRDELFKKLRKKGIFCSRIWQNPLYLDLPNTAFAASRIINLPLQNWFTKKDIDKIVLGLSP